MKDPRVYLAHILESIERIQEYTQDGKEPFLANRMSQDAVIRNLEVIGEATRRIKDDYQREHPEIPWRNLTALRNVLIHEYEDVDNIKIWKIIEKEIPLLRDTIIQIIPPLNQLEAELAGEGIHEENALEN